jgi:hypothetical protein
VGLLTPVGVVLGFGVGSLGHIGPSAWARVKRPGNPGDSGEPWVSWSRITGLACCCPTRRTAWADGVIRRSFGSESLT